MGSLMAGWDSPVADPKSVTYQRNWSFTKGAIDAYWRSKKRTEEEHLRAISGLSENSQNSNPEPGEKLKRSTSLPLPNRGENFMNVDSKVHLKEIISKNDWWTRSNWAFLNEPPVIAAEGPSYKYASQYHIFSSSKPDASAGVSA